MKTGFEEKFTDIQSGLISLCVEAAEKKVDIIYAYAYIGDGSSMFNAFYECEGSIVPAHNIIKDKSVLTQVMKYGTNDLETLRSLCANYEVKCPTEMKLCYNCITKKFSADYMYDSSIPVGFSPTNSFLTWRKELASMKG